MSETISIELEIDGDLMKWFEEYCQDGLMDLDEEVQAVLIQFMQEQIDEAGGVEDSLNFEEEEEDAEEYADYDEEKEE